MFSGSYALLMAEYNAFMNARFYAGAASLSDEDRKRDRGAFFKSIHATLEHLLWGDRVWLTRFNGKQYPQSAIGERMFENFAELQAARSVMDQEILDWARDVTPEWLAQPITWTSRLYKFTQTQPQWVLVTQMFNHQTHHRGQVHALLTQCGVDVGPTDIPVLPILNEA
jgi:uncharacterized damage-inducible protein DinB